MGCEKHALYHALIGSSPLGNWSDFNEIDFPDKDYSVEQFVRELVQEAKSDE